MIGNIIQAFIDNPSPRSRDRILLFSVYCGGGARVMARYS